MTGTEFSIAPPDRRRERVDLIIADPDGQRVLIPGTPGAGTPLLPPGDWSLLAEVVVPPAGLVWRTAARCGRPLARWGREARRRAAAWLRYQRAKVRQW